MAIFNALYTFASCRRTQPIQADSRVSIELAPPKTKCQKFTSWAQWIATAPLSLPVRVAHGLYNVYLMAKCKEIHEPVGRQVYAGNQINYMPLGGINFHILSSPPIMHAVQNHYRNDPHGVFQGEIIAEAFLPLLQNLYPNAGVTKEDFLFTCSEKMADGLRRPFLQFIGPQALLNLRPQIVQVTGEICDYLATREIEGCLHMETRDLTEMLTVTMLSRLFLNLPGTYEQYADIGKAATFALNFQLVRRWSNPPPAQRQEYILALYTLKEAIEGSSGVFRDALENANMSVARSRGTLLLVYLAGSDTTSSMLQYILWRLGQEQQWQSKIRDARPDSPEEPNPVLEQFINECERLYAPADLASRYARQDLVIKVTNKAGKVWEYPIRKGDGVMCSPYLAGRNRNLVDNPDAFIPDRTDGKRARAHVFSGGKHGCPGQWFARAEMMIVVSEILNRYDLGSLPDKPDLTMKGFMTLKLEDTQLTLTRRT